MDDAGIELSWALLNLRQEQSENSKDAENMDAEGDVKYCLHAH